MANNPTLLTRPLAEDGQMNTIPDTTDATSGLFSQQYGWQSINSLPLQAGGKAVKREDFNGAFNLLGGVAFYTQKGWTFIYNTTQAYYAGCIVADVLDGKRYRCIADVAAGQGNPSEDTDFEYWMPAEVADNPYYYRQPGTAYAQGAVTHDPAFPSWVFLQCKTAGTSDTGAITVPAVVEENVEVTDGTVTWVIKRVGSADGIAVGIILPFAGNGNIPSGYLLCDGAAYSRTAFPDLFAAIGTDYGSGDGSTTFNVPDSNQAKRFLQGDVTAGTVKNAGLPNITGDARLSYGYDVGVVSAIGAFGASNDTTLRTASTTGTASGKNHVTFDASASNPIYGNSTTVQPNALTTRYIIKAFDGQTADSALVDITQFENELGGKADRSLSNLTDAGKSFSFPSDTYLDITSSFSTTSATYTAPADGYVAVSGISTTTGSNYIFLYVGQMDTLVQSQNTVYPSGEGIRTCAPVKKGDIVHLIINATQILTSRFIYAQGEVPA